MSDVVLLPENFTRDDEHPRGDKNYFVIAIVFATIFAMVVAVLCADLSHVTSIYIQDVYIPALDTNGTAQSFNASIFVDLKFQRPVAMRDMVYRDWELILFYGHRTTPVAGYRVRVFGMGRERRVHKTAAMEAPELPWEGAFRMVAGGLTVELVVEFRKIYRAQGECGLRAYVAVDASGHMVSEGPIKLVDIRYRTCKC